MGITDCPRFPAFCRLSPQSAMARGIPATRWPIHPTGCSNEGPPPPSLPVISMPTLPLGIRVAIATFAASLALSSASAQPAAAPARPIAAPAPRGASCHNGMSFDRFLAELKAQAVAACVSQRAIAEAAPYLVYDQGIVNRDRGLRARREGIWRAAGGHRLVLGTGERFRPQYGQSADAALAGVAGL